MGHGPVVGCLLPLLSLSVSATAGEGPWLDQGLLEGACTPRVSTAGMEASDVQNLGLIPSPTGIAVKGPPVLS